MSPNNPPPPPPHRCLLFSLSLSLSISFSTSKVLADNGELNVMWSDCQIGELLIHGVTN